MTPSRVWGTAVVAVGGNALTAAGQAGTAAEIEANAAEMAAGLAPLVRAGRRVAVVHGNGPQVGNLALQQDAVEGSVPAQPLHQLCAMTQGQLGSVLVRAIDGVCGPGTAACVVTHVVVDPADPAFGHPTKPIGPFFGRERAEQLARERGWSVVEDSGRGHRRVVASPRPAGIVEIGAVSALLAAGHVVLAAGGGGVAVEVGPDGAMRGLDAVVDKDHAAAALAAAVGATELYLLTGVDSVLLDFGTPDQRPVDRLTAEEAERHLADGQFPPGSMGPKVTAALEFLQQGGRRVVITSLALLDAAAAGRPGAGTRIEPVRQPVGSAR
jgi:carbamate kinase